MFLSSWLTLVNRTFTNDTSLYACSNAILVSVSYLCEICRPCSSLIFKDATCLMNISMIVDLLITYYLVVLRIIQR